MLFPRKNNLHHQMMWEDLVDGDSHCSILLMSAKKMILRSKNYENVVKSCFSISATLALPEDIWAVWGEYSLVSYKGEDEWFTQWLIIRSLGRWPMGARCVTGLKVAPKWSKESFWQTKNTLLVLSYNHTAKFAERTVRVHKDKLLFLSPFFINLLFTRRKLDFATRKTFFCYLNFYNLLNYLN